LSGVTGIAAGGNHTVALKNDGTVVAWGYNRYGQVTGTPTLDGPYSATASPVTLGGQILSGVTAIAAGGGHTVALKNDGTVVTWGGQKTPVPVAAQSGVTAIAAGAGGSHTVALKNDGTVVAWGSNSYGETTVPVAAQGGVTAITAGGGYTVALKNDGTVVAWGYNFYGAVTGTPTNDDAIASPVTLEGQVLSGVTAIAGGGRTVALIGGVPLLPSLNARPNGNELALFWPTNAVGFTLQSTLDLTPPVTWIDSTSVPAVIGAHFTLTNTTSGGVRFYRLRKM
jgi:alpha-tubulin suppressor-like RCC1 family protein